MQRTFPGLGLQQDLRPPFTGSAWAQDGHLRAWSVGPVPKPGRSAAGFYLPKLDKVHGHSHRHTCTHSPALTHTHTHDRTISDKPGTEDRPTLAQTDLCRAGFTAVTPLPSTGPLRALGFLPRLQRKQRSPGSLPSGPAADSLAEPTSARKSRLAGTSHVDIMHPW